MKLSEARIGMLVRRVSGARSFVQDNPRAQLKGRRAYEILEILPPDPSRPTDRRARVRLVGTPLEESIQIHRLEPIPDSYPSGQTGPTP